MQIDLGLEVGQIVRGEHEDEPVHPPGQEAERDVPLAFRILVGASREDAHAVPLGGVLDRAVERGVELVADACDEEPEAVGAALCAP